MSETQSQPTSDAPPAPPERQPTESLSQQADDDATRPLEYGNGQQQSDGEDKPEDKPPEKSADELRKDERRREAQRIAHLTKNRYAQQARAEAAERKAQELEQRLQQYTGQPAQGQPTAADIDRLTQERAQQLVAEQERVRRVNDWDAAGKVAHGEQEFAKACQTVADMADDTQRRTLLAVAMDVEGAQGAIVRMADDADLAERILRLPPHRMALELEKLADKPEAKPTKPATTLGAPIKPPTIGHAKTLPDPNGSWDQFQRWSATVNWKR